MSAFPVCQKGECTNMTRNESSGWPAPDTTELLQPDMGVPDTVGARDAVQRFVFALGVADFLDHICF